MISAIRNVLAVIGALGIIAGGLALYLRYIEHESNDFSVVNKYSAPGGSRDAWLYQRSGGAWVFSSWCNEGIAITLAGKGKPNSQAEAEEHRIFEADCDSNPSVVWLSEAAITIQFSGTDSPTGVEAFMKDADATKTVRVSFQIGAHPGVQADVHEKP